MLLCEADAKALLRDHGLAVPKGRVLGDDEAPPDAAAVVKAQMLAGGRGKAGLVRLADAEGIAAAVTAVREGLAERGLPPILLIEEPLAIEAEFYLAVRVDGRTQSPCLLFSPAGGIAVESAPDRLATQPLDPAEPVLPHRLIPFLRQAGAPAARLGALARLAADLARVFQAEEADLVEINPVAAVAGGRLVLADAKVSLDDNAAFRHRGRRFALSERIAAAERSPLEARADAAGFTLVEMPGDVALVTAGAGLGMMMVDLRADTGFRAAPFIDNAISNLGDTTEARLALAFDLAERPEIKAILFYVTLTSRSLKDRVEALLAFLDRAPPPKPLFIGLNASHVAEQEMTTAEARTLLTARGYEAASDPRELVERLRAAIAPPPSI
jgi:succinyl-CoA synthetase beta subunit